MKVTVDPSLMSLSGRWSRKDNTVIALNKKTGKMHQYVLNENVQQPNSELQQAVKEQFTAKSHAASAWWNANKPATKDAAGTALYTELMKRYDAQFKYGNPFNFVRSLITDDLKIKIGPNEYAIDATQPLNPGTGTGGNQGGNQGGSGSGSGGGGDDDPNGQGALG